MQFVCQSFAIITKATEHIKKLQDFKGGITTTSLRPCFDLNTRSLLTTMFSEVSDGVCDFAKLFKVAHHES